MSEDAMKAERDPWLGIELRHLAALAAVAREASFSGAADTLGYVQSAVSQQISSLERIVGQRLVDRSARPRSVTLTDAGATMLDHVHEILDQLALAKADIDDLGHESDGAVSFGVDSLFGSWLSAAAVGTLLPETGGESWDRIELGPGPELLRQVAEGTLDAAFVPLPIASGPFYALEITRQPYRLAAPIGVTSSDDVATVRERYPLVRIPRCRASAAMIDRSGPSGTRGAPEPTATGPASALAIVRSGAACAVMTLGDAPDDDPSITTLPLPDLADCVIGLAWHRDRDGSPAVAALAAAARRGFGDPRCPAQGTDATS
jgi:DNA-binding transcriptional LysR family regulator